MENKKGEFLSVLNTVAGILKTHPELREHFISVNEGSSEGFWLSSILFQTLDHPSQHFPAFLRVCNTIINLHGRDDEKSIQVSQNIQWSVEDIKGLWKFAAEQFSSETVDKITHMSSSVFENVAIEYGIHYEEVEAIIYPVRAAIPTKKNPYLYDVLSSIIDDPEMTAEDKVERGKAVLTWALSNDQELVGLSQDYHKKSSSERSDRHTVGKNKPKIQRILSDTLARLESENFISNQVDRILRVTLHQLENPRFYKADDSLVEEYIKFDDVTEFETVFNSFASANDFQGSREIEDLESLQALNLKLSEAIANNSSHVDRYSSYADTLYRFRTTLGSSALHPIPDWVNFIWIATRSDAFKKRLFDYISSPGPIENPKLVMNDEAFILICKAFPEDIEYLAKNVLLRPENFELITNNKSRIFRAMTTVFPSFDKILSDCISDKNIMNRVITDQASLLWAANLPNISTENREKIVEFMLSDPVLFKRFLRSFSSLPAILINFHEHKQKIIQYVLDNKDLQTLLINSAKDFNAAMSIFPEHIEEIFTGFQPPSRLINQNFLSGFLKQIPREYAIQTVQKILSSPEEYKRVVSVESDGAQMMYQLCPDDMEKFINNIFSDPIQFKSFIASIGDIMYFEGVFQNHKPKLIALILSNSDEFQRLIIDVQCISTFVWYFPDHQQDILNHVLSNPEEFARLFKTDEDLKDAARLLIDYPIFQSENIAVAIGEVTKKSILSAATTLAQGRRDNQSAFSNMPIELIPEILKFISPDETQQSTQDSKDIATTAFGLQLDALALLTPNYLKEKLRGDDETYKREVRAVLSKAIADFQTSESNHIPVKNELKKHVYELAKICNQYSDRNKVDLIEIHPFDALINIIRSGDDDWHYKVTAKIDEILGDETELNRLAEANQLSASDVVEILNHPLDYIDEEKDSEEVSYAREFTLITLDALREYPLEILQTIISIEQELTMDKVLQEINKILADKDELERIASVPINPWDSQNHMSQIPLKRVEEILTATLEILSQHPENTIALELTMAVLGKTITPVGTIAQDDMNFEDIKDIFDIIITDSNDFFRAARFISDNRKSLFGSALRDPEERKRLFSNYHDFIGAAEEYMPEEDRNHLIHTVLQDRDERNRLLNGYHELSMEKLTYLNTKEGDEILKSVILDALKSPDEFKRWFKSSYDFQKAQEQFPDHPVFKLATLDLAIAEVTTMKEKSDSQVSASTLTQVSGQRESFFHQRRDSMPDVLRYPPADESQENDINLKSIKQEPEEGTKP